MSFRYAIEGIISAIKGEAHLRFHIVIANLIAVFAYVYEISKVEWAILTVSIFAVISAELFNTAIEAVVDIAMPYKNQKAKKAKDISAAAVLILSMCAAIIGLTIFIPKML